MLATSRKDDAGESTRAESAQSFSVTYPTPRVTDFPKGGRVGNNVEILGADLDIISKVFMGDEEERSFIRVKRDCGKSAVYY